MGLLLFKRMQERYVVFTHTSGGLDHLGPDGVPKPCPKQREETSKEKKSEGSQVLVVTRLSQHIEGLSSKHQAKGIGTYGGGSALCDGTKREPTWCEGMPTAAYKQQ